MSVLRKYIMIAAAALAISPVAVAQQSQSAAAVDSLSRAAATYMGELLRGSLDNLKRLGGNIDMDIFIDALAKTLRGEDTGFDYQSSDAYIADFISSRPNAFDALAEQTFVDRMSATEGAITTPSGLVFIVETEGEGEMPTDSDTVTVMYVGRLSDGSEFDRTEEPFSFVVTDVTPGFSEGLKLMRPGGRYRLVMPSSLGYGEDGIPGAIPGNAALDFTVELIGVNSAKY